MLRSAAARVPAWAWALAAALAWGGIQHHRAAAAGDQLRVHDAEVAAATLKASQAAQLETARRLTAQTEITNEAQDRARAADVDAAGARAAADRLRARLGAARPGARAADPAPAGGCAPAPDAAGVPADLFWRAVDAAGLYAAEADRRGIAGAACVESYRALIKP